jgi:hypothetical protein
VTRYSLRASSLDDIDGMAHHLRTRRIVPASADRLFDILATGEGQTTWAHGYRSTRWLTVEPHGVGSVRDIHLKWITVRERFLAWDPGRRFTFSSDAMSLPLARALIEDIEFEALTPSSCRLTWTVHLTPAAALRPVSGTLARRVFAPMFDGFAAGLADYGTRHPQLVGH